MITQHPSSLRLLLLLVITQRAVECVIQDITQRKHALEMSLVVNDDEAMDTGFANGVEDGV